MLEINTEAPNFHLLDVNNNLRSLDEFLGKKIVLYFYPKDNTTGCSKQAVEYKNIFSDFEQNNTVVIGISKDSVKSHIKFMEKYSLPFLLLSDEQLEAIKLYDVWHEKKLYGKKYMGVVRTTYIINEKGIIVYANDTVNVGKDAICSLYIVKEK